MTSGSVKTSVLPDPVNAMPITGSGRVVVHMGTLLMLGATLTVTPRECYREALHLDGRRALDGRLLGTQRSDNGTREAHFCK